MARLTDDSKSIGPLSWGTTTWKAFRINYSSYEDLDDLEEKGNFKNSLTIHIGNFVARIYLPKIIKPHFIKIEAKDWSEETIKRLGRNYYYEYFNREYGFTYYEGNLTLKYGVQQGNGMYEVNEQSKFWSVPWKQYRLVRDELYDANNVLFWKDERLLDKSIDKSLIFDHYVAKSKCSSIDFLIEDYDGEKVVLKTYLEIREWKRGDGLFKWMSWFRKGIFKRSLELDFTKEVGKSKGSWKGGMIGHSIELLDGETRLDAIKRYCEQTHRSKEGSYKLKYIRQITDIESSQLPLPKGRGL